MHIPFQVHSRALCTSIIWGYAGDTFILEKNNERVRLIGINAPESVKPGEKAQPFGQEAGRLLKEKLAGQEVKLVFDAAPRDKYGRLLAYVQAVRPTAEGSQSSKPGIMGNAKTAYYRKIE